MSRRGDAGPAAVEETIAEVLRRRGYQPEGVTRETPFDAVAAADERGADAEADREAEELGELSAVAGRMLTFFFADGPHPAAVMRRVFAWAKKFRPDLVGNLSLRDLAAMSGESHEAWRWRIEQWFDRFQERKGGEAVRAPWQRGDTTREACRRAQKGNRNRLGGRKRR
jgi:hypothetical protein